MRACLYSRVSHDPTGRGRSVREQDVENEQVCEKEGWQIVERFVDNDRSASRYATKKRPGWEQLVAFVEAGGCDVLVTWEASRFQRDLEVYVQLRELCRARAVLWSYNGRTYDPTRTDDRFQTGLDALLAERESDQTRDRIMRTVRSNAVAGRPHGRVPFGYRREYDPVSKEFLGQPPDPGQAAVLVEAARRVLGGETTYAVAQDFNHRRIPTPGTEQRWLQTTVRRLLINPTYVGKRTFQGKVIGDAVWPPILDEVTHMRLVALLTDPKRLSTREATVKHLMSGVALCGVCDGPVCVQKNRGSLSYICKWGFHVARRTTFLDRYVTGRVIARLARPDAARYLGEDPAADVAEALEELAALRARHDALAEAAATGEMTPALLAKSEARLLPQIEKAQARASRLSAVPVLTGLAGRPDAGEVWTGLSVAKQRAVIQALCEVRILRTRQGARALDPRSVQLTWRRM